MRDAIAALVKQTGAIEQAAGKLGISDRTPLQVLKTQTGQQIVYIILTGYDVITCIGMNLRTFTLGLVF